MKPRSAVVAITHRCNARCLMCDIWQRDDGSELPATAYLRLPPSLREVNVSGGEPFLRRDLPEVLAAMQRACPRARLVISSNGLAVGRIRDMAPRLAAWEPVLGVRISIDGLAETHDRLRGTPGAFARAVESLEALQGAGVRDLGIGTTIVEENLADVGQVYRLAEARGVEFSLTLVTGSEIYFGPDKAGLRPRSVDGLGDALAGIIHGEYRHRRPKRWFRAWFGEQLVRYATEDRRTLPCDAARGFFYLDPAGDVYGCHLLPHRLGNLLAADWASIWQGPAAEQARREVAGCQDCWMVCTARTQMRRQIGRVGGQVLLGKLRAHLARRDDGGER
jgi:radical SAM protein with 4Fe4S-binding SPASM domain